MERVSVFPSVPASVKELFAVRVFPSAIVKVEPVTGAVIVSLFIEVAVATPSVGVTSVGLVASTTLPEPVVVAAEIAVPLPCKIPVAVVEIVIAGVVVAVATVPANPFAVTTETLVTVPEAEALSIRRRPVTGSSFRGNTTVASVLD